MRRSEDNSRNMDVTRANPAKDWMKDFKWFSCVRQAKREDAKAETEPELRWRRDAMGRAARLPG